MYSDTELTNDNNDTEFTSDDDAELTKDIYSKKTSLKMNAPSFTYDNTTITVTHHMALHINIPERIDFQKIFYKSSPSDEPYFLELIHIIFTALISKVPDSVTFKLYVLNIPSCEVPHEFARDAIEILKPLILTNPNTMYTYEKYFIDKEWSETSTDEEK